LDPPPGGITRRLPETEEDPAVLDVDVDVAAVVFGDGVVGEAELPELVDGGVAVEVAEGGVAIRATAEDAVVLVAMAVVGDDEHAPKLTPTSAASPATIKDPRNLGYRFMKHLPFVTVTVTRIHVRPVTCIHIKV